MDLDYIIVQAGGKGTRLEHLTKNKPKALVPVNNLPMLFHLFRLFPDKKFIIIGDYKKDVLKEYLRFFSTVNYEVVDADGTGTCGGIGQALSKIPENKSFMLIWSDLILPQDFIIPQDKGNYVGISGTFECRWSYKYNKFIEEKSKKYGVAGCFLFENKKVIFDVPNSGEFVRYLGSKKINFKKIDLKGTCEFGLLEEYNKLELDKCRPFNKVTIKGNKFIKEPADEQGVKLAKNEINWYKKANELGFKDIPQIYSFDPLIMEKIDGKNIYEYKNIPFNDKKRILKKLIEELKELHNLDSVDADLDSIKSVYIDKTFDRIKNIQNLIPFANNKYIEINGKKCRNVYFYKDELISKLNDIKVEKFHFIHGDCTFSNIMLKNDTQPVLIDPRGYFGNTLLYGDVNYDFAKLYYSVVGDYDMFNLKKFRLTIGAENVNIEVESNGWKELEDYFFELTKLDKYTIKLLHAIIWLSLTTYAWQDYDSICGAFYIGLLYLEEVL